MQMDCEAASCPAENANGIINLRQSEVKRGGRKQTWRRW